MHADALAKTLKSTPIHSIYCSPFLRTLQTIYPYCAENKQKVNIENAFYESLDDNKFNRYNYRHRVADLVDSYPHLLRIVDSGYKSTVFVSNIRCQETAVQVTNRVFPFVCNLCSVNKGSGKTFLIVTHGTICNAIKKFFNDEVELSDHFPEGKYEVIDVGIDWKSRFITE